MNYVDKRRQEIANKYGSQFASRISNKDIMLERQMRKEAEAYERKKNEQLRKFYK